MLVFTMKIGTEAEKWKQQVFIDLARRYREEQDPDLARWLGDQLGRLIFCGGRSESNAGTIQEAH